MRVYVCHFPCSGASAFKKRFPRVQEVHGPQHKRVPRQIRSVNDAFAETEKHAFVKRGSFMNYS